MDSKFNKKQPTNPVLDFIISLVRSLLISVLLFIIFFSIVTREFPPSPTRVKNIYESLKKIITYTQVYMENTTSPDDIEKDIKKFRDIQDYRREESKKLEALLWESHKVREQIKTSPTTDREELVNLKTKIDLLLQHQKSLDDRLSRLEQKIK